MLRSVKSHQRLPKVMGFIVDGTGTASLGGMDASHATLTDNGTGDYTVTFSQPFARTPTVCVTPVTSGVDSWRVVVSGSAVQILTFDAVPAAKDADFHLMVLGSEDEAAS